MQVLCVRTETGAGVLETAVFVWDPVPVSTKIGCCLFEVAQPFQPTLRMVGHQDLAIEHVVSDRMEQTIVACHINGSCINTKSYQKLPYHLVASQPSSTSKGFRPVGISHQSSVVGCRNRLLPQGSSMFYSLELFFYVCTALSGWKPPPPTKNMGVLAPQGLSVCRNSPAMQTSSQ